MDNEKRKSCPGCEKKPAAVKTDNDGNCISICEIGTVEFVREYQDAHNVSEREAVRAFIEVVKAKLSDDDPVLDELTEGSIRSKVRRNTGKDKKKAVPKVAQSEPLLELTEFKQESKRHLCLPTVDGVQIFLKEYLPGYKIVHDSVECKTKTI